MSSEEAVNVGDVDVSKPPEYVPRKITNRAEMVDACERIGKQIGHYCHEAGVSLLYDLRRCKRYEKFLEVLDRLKGKIPGLGTDREFLNYLDKHRSEWREYKSFISIFAKDLMFSIEYAKAQQAQGRGRA